MAGRKLGRVRVVDMDIVGSLKAELYVKFPENEPKKSTYVLLGGNT